MESFADILGSWLCIFFLNGTPITMKWSWCLTLPGQKCIFGQSSPVQTGDRPPKTSELSMFVDVCNRSYTILGIQNSLKSSQIIPESSELICELAKTISNSSANKCSIILLHKEIYNKYIRWLSLIYVNNLNILYCMPPTNATEDSMEIHRNPGDHAGRAQQRLVQDPKTCVAFLVAQTVSSANHMCRIAI